MKLILGILLLMSALISSLENREHTSERLKREGLARIQFHKSEINTSSSEINKAMVRFYTRK